MKNSIEILDALSVKLGDASDYKISQVTGISSAVISTTRTGRRPLPPSALKLAAKVLGVEAGVLIAIVEASKAKDPEIRDSLMRVANSGMKIAAQAGKGARRRAAAAAMVLVAAGAVMGSPAPAQAATPTAEAKALFIMSTRTRRRRTRRRAPGQAYPKRTKPIVYRDLRRSRATVLQKISYTPADTFCVA